MSHFKIDEITTRPAVLGYLNILDTFRDPKGVAESKEP